MEGKEYYHVFQDWHEHEYQGQKLRHTHEYGEREHGYFEHPEDGVDLSAKLTKKAPVESG
jgi:hypothetical protein